jgi:excisionase family DNA binding protein
MRRKKQTPRRRNKNPQAAEELLTVRQVAENWQVSERTVRRMIADGRLRIVRVGRAVRIPPEASATLADAMPPNR